MKTATFNKTNTQGIEICQAMGVDPTKTRRIILDICVGEPITAYIELIPDDDDLDSLLNELRNYERRPDASDAGTRLW